MIVNHNQKNKLPNELIIWDETLRDGEQAPGVAFSLDQKIKLAKLLDEVGVGIIDTGFPAVSKEEQEAVIAINKLGLKAKTGVTVRADIQDIDCSIKCGVDSVFLFAPTSKLHIQCKFQSDYSSLRKRT